MDYIMEYTTDIRFVPGQENTAADAVSSVGVNTCCTERSAMNYGDLAKEQSIDTTLQHLRETTTSLKLQDVNIPDCADTLVCDASTGLPRPYVPEKFMQLLEINFPGLAFPLAPGNLRHTTLHLRSIHMAHDELRFPQMVARLH